MPTEFRPGKIDQTSSDSIVDVLTNSNLPVLRSNVTPDLSMISNNNFTKKNTNFETLIIQQEDKITFFSFIKNILLSDVLWFSVAFACLLATILFYFQILQPLVLQKYSESANAQIIEGTQKFYLQADQADSLNQKILSNTENLSSDSCSEEAKYDQSDKDRKDLENLKTSLTLDPKIKELQNFGIFYDNQIKTTYGSFVNDYEKSLNDFQPIIANTKHVIEFVDYKDNWIDQCIAIKNSLGETLELQSICKDTDTRSENYIKIAPAGIISELSEPLKNIRSLCTDIYSSKYENYAQFNNFKLKWLSEYDNIKAISILTDSVSITSIKNNFEKLSKEASVNIEKTAQSRQEFGNIWYLLNFFGG